MTDNQPGPQVVTVVDVTDTEDRPHLVPWLVDALVARGFRVLGRLATGKRVDSARLAFEGSERDRVDAWRERPARTLLANSDGTAYAVVDTFGDAPFLRLRTLLDDGSLVETVGVSSHGLLVPASGDPLMAFHAAETAGRALRLLHHADPDVVVPTHERLVGDISGPRGLRPVEHADRAAAVDLWNAATAHLLACASKQPRDRPAFRYPAG